MAPLKLKSKCSTEHYSILGVCLVMGTLLLVQMGCSRSPEPVALDLEIDEDTTVSITLTSSQSSKTGTTYQISSLPKHGSISGKPPKIRYTPPENFFGVDEFEYVTIRNGGRVSKPATITIQITAVNDSPVAEPISTSTTANMEVRIQPQAVDVDGQVVEYAIVTPPGYGEAEVHGAEFRYSPRTGFIGDDGFEYVAIDETGLRSANTLVKIRVSVRSEENQTSAESVVESLPEESKPTPTATEAMTTPDAIISSDIPENTVPAAEDLEVVLLEDSDSHIELKATDDDGTVTQFGITTLPTYGSLSGVGAKRTYTPKDDFFGTDSFSYVAIDDQGGVSTPAVVSIVVDAVNDAPTADSSNWFTVEDSSGLYLDLLAQDPDGHIVAYRVVRAPKNGKIDDVGNGRWLYIPDQDFAGMDSFQWIAIDNEGARSLEAVVSLTVTEQPDPPVIRLRNSSYETTVGKQLDIDVIVTDPERDATRFEIRDEWRSIGKFRPNRGTIAQLADLRFDATKRGIGSYRIEVHDRTGLSSHASFTIEVVNTPPVVELPIPSYDRTKGIVNLHVRARDPDGTINHFVVQTIDNRRAETISVNGSRITDAQSFTTGGACEIQDGVWCTLNVEYKPDVIDGHSRRIRIYAVDDEGISSPKDFVRIETRQLQVANQPQLEEENNPWNPHNPRIRPAEPEESPGSVDPPSDDVEEAVPIEDPPLVVEDEDEPAERDPDHVIIERIDNEEINQVTDPDREVPRQRR